MPQFSPGSAHKATATFSNPRSAGFDYTASLCMGADWTVMASASFHLNAGQSKAVEFSVTMPTALGTYPVFFKVSSGGVLVGTFTATEAITVVAPPDPYALAGGYTYNMDDSPGAWGGGFGSIGYYSATGYGGTITFAKSDGTSVSQALFSSWQGWYLNYYLKAGQYISVIVQPTGYPAKAVATIQNMGWG